ncbi:MULTISPECIES: YadA-like family protein [unclassified Acinetobacter]|uniref:YadA C-terminal domain-containing protein n=1 Tax=unclassified Acinetobacter TaxID=196816 RepID=UPI0015D1DBA2|nr:MULTISPECIES: YadA-like family protein [unclassified Acinetobacter]
MTFKKSALAAAVLTVVAGNALAATVTTPETRFKPTGPFSGYLQSEGYSTSVIDTNFTSNKTFLEVQDSNVVISAGTPEPVAGQPGVERYSETREGTVETTSNSSDWNLTDNTKEDSRTVDTSSYYSANGLVTRTAQTRTLSIPFVGTVTIREADVGTLTEDNFEAYDLTKKAGAFEETRSSSRTAVDYNDNQVLDHTIESKRTRNYKDNAVAYDQNGQPVQVDGQTSYVVLEDTSERNFNLTAYNSDVENGVETSRGPDGKLLVVDRSRSSTEQDANYQYDDISGDFVTFKVEGNDVLVSNISEQTKARASTYINYDDVSVKDFERSRSGTNNSKDTAVLDGFEQYDNRSWENSVTQYNDGKSNIDQESSFKFTQASKDRDFLTDEDGVVLVNGKPVVDKVTEVTSSVSGAYSNYQATEDANGDDFVITKNGNDTRWTDTDLKHRSFAYDYQQTVTDQQDGFVAHDIRQFDGSADYYASMQENIEVDRDLELNSLSDQKYKTGPLPVVNTYTPDQVTSGFRRKLDGSPVTAADVNTWTDQNGTDHYYVVLGHDRNGQEIRSEVQYTDGSASSLTLNAVQEDFQQRNSTESVRYNEDEFYKSTDSFVNKEKTTYEDGSVEYDNSTLDQTITVYNENVVDKEWEGTRAGTQATQDVTFVDVGGVATAAQIDTSASSFAEKTTKYKPGQELEEETARTETQQGSHEDLLAETTEAYQNNWEFNDKLYAAGASDLLHVSTVSGNGTSSYTSDTQTQESEWALNNDETIYQAGDINSTETGSTSQSTTTTDLVTGNSETYATNGQFASTEFNTVTGLLASQAVLSTEAAQRQESLSQTEAGVTTSTTVVRGYEDEQRSDESATLTVYGSETNVAGDGSQTVLAKSETTVVDKFGIEESNELTQTDTNITAAGATTTTTQQRTDDVAGIQLEKTVAGTTTQTSSTTISAGEISVDGVSITANGLNANNTVVSNVANGVADSDAANLGQVRSYYNDVSGRVNQLNTRVDDVEKTSYRGIAIALAAQQQIPNIGAGQFAVFGGVGHYEGESAGALGVASVFADGRTSVSAAVGFSGGNEVGGRVGVSYVFGGK